MKRSTCAISIMSGLLLLSSAAADDMPQQKPGLWETRMQYSADGKSGDHVTQHCIDVSALAHGKQIAEDYAKKNCSKNDTRQEGAAWVTDMVCKAGGSEMTTHSVTAFSSPDAFHTEMKITYAPPVASRSASTTTVDGKWLGACTAGT